MLLPREFVAYLSRQIVRRLSPGTIETPVPEKVTELTAAYQAWSAEQHEPLWGPFTTGLRKRPNDDD